MLLAKSLEVTQKMEWMSGKGCHDLCLYAQLLYVVFLIRKLVSVSGLAFCTQVRPPAWRDTYVIPVESTSIPVKGSRRQGLYMIGEEQEIAWLVVRTQVLVVCPPPISSFRLDSCAFILSC